VTAGKTRVLFVCIGNSCRSQMAEAFARSYGNDVLIPASAGLAPAMTVAPDTVRAMLAKNLDLRDHFPKSLRHLSRSRFDLVVNMTGYPLPDDIGAPILEWAVDDPVAEDYEKHCDIRDEIECLVVGLVARLRNESRRPRFHGQGSGRLKV
jgi:arsenate reductase